MLEFRKNYKGTISLATTEEEQKFLEKEAQLLTKKKIKIEKQGNEESKENIIKENNERIEEEIIEYKAKSELVDSDTLIQIEATHIKSIQEDVNNSNNKIEDMHINQQSAMQEELL